MNTHPRLSSSLHYRFAALARCATAMLTLAAVHSLCCHPLLGKRLPCARAGAGKKGLTGRKDCGDMRCLLFVGGRDLSACVPHFKGSSLTRLFAQTLFSVDQMLFVSLPIVRGRDAD